MENKVLVAYASKYGATAEIAEHIGRTLRASGVTAEVKPAEQVDDVSAYAAVVLGSAVYAGQWRKEASAFLETNERALAERPVWLFSSGPTGDGNPSEIMHGWRFPEAQQPVADRIQPRDVVFFHGAIDMKKLSFPEKLLVRGIKAPVGDFRNWDSISAWANAMATALRASS
ncbi:MAG: flavodoxin domain-containing protein [Anaerolineae bacterium]|nr:flavodoxin domain-containing protein [Anaerolineae bacterium]